MSSHTGNLTSGCNSLVIASVVREYLTAVRDSNRTVPRVILGAKVHRRLSAPRLRPLIAARALRGGLSRIAVGKSRPRVGGR
jgi:hypothetical protein